MKKILSVAFIFLAYISLSAQNQAPNVEWAKCFGGSFEDRAKSIIELKGEDGGYVVAGYTYSYDGDIKDKHGVCDYWLVELNQSGELLWQKCFGGSGDDWVMSIIETKDGGYIIAGYTNSNDGDVKGNHGNYDMWIVKLSPETSIEDYVTGNNILSISPNPASENITISYPNIEATCLAITNSIGMEIKRFTSSELEGQSAISYSTNEIPSDIYYCTLSSGHERVTKRFVVVK